MSMKRFVKKTAVAASMAAALALSSGSAFALLDANILTATNINSFDVNLGGGNFLNNVNQLNWTGFALSDFGAAGAPSITGSTFTDYIVLNLQTGTTSGGGTQGIPNTTEVTAFIQATGIITNGVTGAFNFTGISNFDVRLDSILLNQGADALDRFGEYFDGQLVLSADGLSNLTTSPVANTGALTPAVGAGGSLNLQAQLVREAANFFLTPDGLTDLFDAFAPEAIHALTEGQVTLAGLQPAGGVLASTDPTVYPGILQNFIDHFSIAASNTLTLALIQTSPTTNIASNPVPEPGVLALLGIGLVGLGAARRNRLAA